MLQKSRELTKKIQVESDSEDEQFPDLAVSIDTDNPEKSLVESTDNPWMARPTSGVSKPAFSRPVEVINQESQDPLASEYSRPGKVASEEGAVNQVDIPDSDNEVVEELIEVENETDSIRVKEEKRVSKKHGTEVHDLSDMNETQTGSKKDINASDVVDRTDTGDVVDRTETSDSESESDVGSNDSNEIDEIFKKMKTGHILTKSQKKRLKRKNKATSESNNESVLDKSSEQIEKSGNNFVNKNKLYTEKYSGRREDKGRRNDRNQTEKEREDVIMNNETVSRKRTVEDFEELLAESEPEVNLPPKRLKTSVNDRKKHGADKLKDKTDEKEAFIDPKKLFTVESKLRQAGPLPSVVGKCNFYFL